MTLPITKVRRSPRRVPRPAPANINAAIVSVKVAMANCMLLVVVPRSPTTSVMETFITVPSSTMTNWVSPNTRIGSHFFMEDSAAASLS